jgi:trans-aconitate methyltransferase
MESSDSWQSGSSYQRFMGRWSALVAPKFLDWLPGSTKARWMDVGCGTGILSELILNTRDPVEILGIDSSPEFIHYARSNQHDPRMRFETAQADALPAEAGHFDLTVSGLALNFIPQPAEAVVEMRRVTRPGGTIAVYVWDYAQGMQMLRYFWDAAVDLNPGSRQLDEGVRFPLCYPEVLNELFQKCDLDDVAVRGIEVPTTFSDYSDYWEPFQGGVGAAPGFVAKLSESDRLALKERLRMKLPTAVDGSITLYARAWAIRGIVQ